MAKKKKLKKVTKISNEEREVCLNSIVECKIELNKELCKREKGDFKKIKVLRKQIDENKKMIRVIEKDKK